MPLSLLLVSWYVRFSPAHPSMSFLPLNFSRRLSLRHGDWYLALSSLVRLRYVPEDPKGRLPPLATIIITRTTRPALPDLQSQHKRAPYRRSEYSPFSLANFILVLFFAPIADLDSPCFRYSPSSYHLILPSMLCLLLQSLSLELHVLLSLIFKPNSR